MFRNRFAMEVAGEVPVAILLSYFANRSVKTNLLFFNTILRTEIMVPRHFGSTGGVHFSRPPKYTIFDVLASTNFGQI